MSRGAEQLARRNIYVLVKGRVQGVFYRQSPRAEALKLGLCGFVRNLADGRVEALACGEAEKVQNLLDFCRMGPPRAQVDELWQLDLEDNAYQRHCLSFEALLEGKSSFHICPDGDQPICLEPGPSKSL